MYRFSKVKDIKRLEILLTIRFSELLLAEKAKQNKFRTPIHLAVGQEGVAVGVSENLEKLDFIFGNHRSHAHFLASGGSPHRLFAEILGKVDGCSGGKGGSMHISEPNQGFVGSMPIVGGTIPISLGAAMTAKFTKKSNLAVTYFGDGAVEEGVFHESLNLASIFCLPVLFVCENNLLSSHLHINQRQYSSNLLRFAVAHGIKGNSVDGNNVEQVISTSKKLIEYIRTTSKPAFLEAKTYRLFGHVGFEEDSKIGQNREEDLKAWSKRDPVKAYLDLMIKRKTINPDKIKNLKIEIYSYIVSSWEKALAGCNPTKKELIQNVYFRGNF